MYFSLDLGGTNFRISRSNSLLSPDFKQSIVKIPHTGNYRQDSQAIINILKSESAPIKGICIALPGKFNYSKFVLESAKNLSDWVEKPFFQIIHQQFPCPLIIQKDSLVAAAGEISQPSHFPPNFLYLTWGTGIGGCQVSHKSPKFPQITPLVWHQHLRRFESLCGGGQSIANFGVKFEQLSQDQWHILVQNFTTQAIRLCQKTGTNYIILGGGVALKQPNIVRQIKLLLKPFHIDLMPSKLGDYSALIGGYYLLSHHYDQ